MANIRREEFRLENGLGVSLCVYAWIPDAPKAVLQIAHGMAEHAQRYDAFAQAMAAQGFAVYASDHAGHGQSALPEHYGFFYPEDGWQRVVEDLHLVHRATADRHPGCPHMLLGHSMGSLLARSYMASYGDTLRGVILSGTAGPNPLLPFGKLLAGLCMRLRPPHTPCKIIDKLVFSANNKSFAPARTPSDWLSRDTAAVDAYIADPACGFVFTATGYRDLFDGLSSIQGESWAAKVPRSLPVLLFSGESDPVGAMGKGVRCVEKALRAGGVEDVTCILYPQGRHEMLNEINREAVYADILAWTARVLG